MPASSWSARSSARPARNSSRSSLRRGNRQKSAEKVNCRAFDATSQQLAALLVASVDGLKQAGAPHLSVRAGVALQLRVLEAATGAAG